MGYCVLLLLNDLDGCRLTSLKNPSMPALLRLWGQLKNWTLLSTVMGPSPDTFYRNDIDESSSESEHFH